MTYDDAVEYLNQYTDTDDPDDMLADNRTIEAIMAVRNEAHYSDDAKRLYRKWRQRLLNDLPNPDDPDFTVPDFPPEAC